MQKNTQISLFKRLHKNKNNKISVKKTSTTKKGKKKESPLLTTRKESSL